MHRYRLFITLTVFAILAGTVYLPASPPLHPVPDRDAGVYLYIARQMLRGEVPYRDIWDHKPPGAYVLPLVGSAITPGSLWGPWLVAALLLALTAYLGFSLLQRYLGTRLSASIICIWLLQMTLFVRRDPFLTETTALPLQIGAYMLAIWLVSGPAWKRARWGWLALGLTIAACALLKPPLAGLPFVTTGIAWLRSPRSERATSLIWIVAGVLGTLSGLVVYLTSQNALPAFFDQVILYNLVYSRATWHERILALQELFTTFTVISILALLGWMNVAWILRDRQESMENRTLLALLWIGLPVDLAFSSISGRPYLHYFIGSFWLEMAFVGAVIRNLPKFDWRPRLSIGLRAILLGVLLLSALQAWYQISRMRTLGEQQQRAAISYLHAKLNQNDSVLFWGAETSMYVATGQKAPARLIYAYPLYTRGYGNPRLARELYSDLQAHPPEFVIDTSATDPLVPPLDLERYASWESPVASYGFTPGSELVPIYISQNYAQIDTINGLWPVYKRQK